MGSNGKLSNRPEQGRKQKQPWLIKFSRRDSQNVVDPTEKGKKNTFLAPKIIIKAKQPIEN